MSLGTRFTIWEGAVRRHPTPPPAPIPTPTPDPTTDQPTPENPPPVVVDPVPSPLPAVPYRPVRVTLTTTTNAARIAELRAQGLDIPTDANLVLWPYATPDEVMFNVWLDSLGANDLAVLPEFTTSTGAKRPYVIDSSAGFRRDASHNFEMAHPKRGWVGLGPNTVITTSASAYTEGQQPNVFTDPFTGVTTNQGGVLYKVAVCTTPNAYFGNFEAWGRDFGGVAYNFLAINKGLWCMENAFFNAAHRGFKASPNGEAGGFTCFTGNIRMVRNVEVECRNALGVRVGSSPWMFNRNVGIRMQDCYGHHSNAGMPTCWRCTGTAATPIVYTRVRSEFCGGTVGTGHSFNWELCVGEATLVDCVAICNYQGTTVADGSNNPGLHMGGGSSEARFTVNTHNLTIDKGPRARNIAGTSKTAADGTFTLTCQLFGYTPQYGIQINRYDKAGNPLPVFIYGTVTA